MDPDSFQVQKKLILTVKKRKNEGWNIIFFKGVYFADHLFFNFGWIVLIVLKCNYVLYFKLECTQCRLYYVCYGEMLSVYTVQCCESWPTVYYDDNDNNTHFD